MKKSNKSRKACKRRAKSNAKSEQLCEQPARFKWSEEVAALFTGYRQELRRVINSVEYVRALESLFDYARRAGPLEHAWITNAVRNQLTPFGKLVQEAARLARLQIPWEGFIDQVKKALWPK